MNKREIKKLQTEEEKYFLPDRLRVDLDTEESQKLLAAAEAQQAIWREEFATPFLNTTPANRERARSLIIIEEYKAIGLNYLTDTQLNQYAEACAEVGMFRAAYLAHTDKAMKKVYLSYNNALELPDEEWCEHGRAHATPEKEVWSYVHGREVTIMCCTFPECGFRNAKDVPGHVTEARSRRAVIRKEFSGLSPLEAKAAMESDPRFSHLLKR